MHTNVYIQTPYQALQVSHRVVVVARLVVPWIVRLGQVLYNNIG
jgi:hypothetical protein